MLFNSKKYEKEIKALHQLKGDRLLNPLRKAQLRESLLNIVNHVDIPEQRKTFWYSKHERAGYFVRYAASAMLGLALIGGGTAFASNAARPGDVLFPVKKATEKARLSLTRSEESRAEISTKIAEDRIGDIDEVDESVKLKAQVEAQTQVNHAIQALTDVQSKLQTKGNTEAATSVAENIARLRALAEQHALQIEVQGTVKGIQDSKLRGNQKENKGKGHN